MLHWSQFGVIFYLLIFSLGWIIEETFFYSDQNIIHHKADFKEISTFMFFWLWKKTGCLKFSGCKIYMKNTIMRTHLKNVNKILL